MGFSRILLLTGPTNVQSIPSNRENENLILDCCQLEPSVDSIKHEESLGNDKSSGSPGGDAPGEGNSHLSAGDMKLNSPKTDPEGHSHRGRGRSAAASHGSSLNSLSLIKDSPTRLGVEIDAGVGVLPTTVATPVPAATPNGSTSGGSGATTKRKRKTKAAQQAEDQERQEQAIPEQPLPKLPAMEQRDQQQPRSRLPSIVDEQQPASSVADSAVKDLEHAMSKHLPSPVAVSVAPPPSTDFSADSLLKQQQQQQQLDPNEKSSTIQWIGTPYQQPPAPMPATALLRQLYANRESVIRATARQTPTGVGPGVFYGDQQSGPLPTPPGSESSYENQYLQLHSAASAGGHPGSGQKTSADAFTNLVSTYGGYHSSIDYHNAMTPPSSVSPRDSNQPGKAAPVLTSNGGGGGYDYAPDPLRGQYATSSGDGGVLPATLPLKPQAYTATMHPSTTTEGGVTYSNLDQPQYFAPHSSFHLYHKGSPTSGWYSTPS